MWIVIAQKFEEHAAVLIPFKSGLYVNELEARYDYLIEVLIPFKSGLYVNNNRSGYQRR